MPWRLSDCRIACYRTAAAQVQSQRVHRARGRGGEKYSTSCTTEISNDGETVECSISQLPLPRFQECLEQKKQNTWITLFFSPLLYLTNIWVNIFINMSFKNFQSSDEELTKSRIYNHKYIPFLIQLLLTWPVLQFPFFPAFFLKVVPLSGDH